MVWIALVFVAFIALAVTCALRLMRPAAVSGEVEPMKKALERRIREGAEFRL
jgi:hypothetical protein